MSCFPSLLLRPVDLHAARLVMAQGVGMVGRLGVQPHPLCPLFPSPPYGRRQHGTADASPDKWRQHAEHGDLHLRPILARQFQNIRPAFLADSQPRSAARCARRRPASLPPSRAGDPSIARPPRPPGRRNDSRVRTVSTPIGPRIPPLCEAAGATATHRLSPGNKSSRKPPYPPGHVLIRRIVQGVRLDARRKTQGIPGAPCCAACLPTLAWGT